MLFKYPLLLLILITAVWFTTGQIVDQYELRDDHPQRGAFIAQEDPFDPVVKKIVYLDQGWKPEESVWFYTITQGSNLLPYDFFLYLEQLNSQELFRSNENINRYRYLPQQKSKRNPDALPVGITLDTYSDKDTGKKKRYMGFTCAACHTTQLNYQDIGIRIDGGPAAADMETFIVDMTNALAATKKAMEENSDKGQRFYENVLAEGHYTTKESIDQDMQKYVLQLRTYVEVNHPVNARFINGEDGCGTILHETNENCLTRYGYARLDAFGRIYNRILQYIMDAEELRVVLKMQLPKDIWQHAESDLERLFNSDDQTHLVERALEVILPHLAKAGEDTYNDVLNNLRMHIYNPSNAPVSYPFLWDTPQHDYVQWTGIVSNGDLGPMGRNVGQVVGAFGSLDWQKKTGWRLNDVIAAQKLDKSHIDFRSSINKRNLRRTERHLHTLQSPQWPEDILGKIDTHLADEGFVIFEKYCASCHQNIIRDDPERRVIAHISNQKTIGTDPVAAQNAANYQGASGMLKNQYVEVGPGKLSIQRQSHVAPLLKFSTQNVMAEWDTDKNFIRRIAEWLYDILGSFFDNKVKKTLKRGDYEPSTSVNPYASVNAYKGRSLNGIWATAPYLHNGSIPSLYELLLPKYRPGDLLIDAFGNDIEYRSNQFYVGSREFDPKKVGFKDRGYDGFLFNTEIPGNSNAGHEYASGKTAINEKIGVLPALTKEQRLALLEYLKTL